MNKLFGWDELSDEVQEREPEELFACNAEGGWVGEGWSEDGKVEIRNDGRHIAMETWAPNAEEALVRFKAARPHYFEEEEGE